jgi:ATP-dependent exoDNAse (exonuclease V) beta subunit
VIHDPGFVPFVARGASHYDKKPIPEELAELVAALARHASALLARELGARNRATRRWLERAIDAELELRFESRRYDFDAPPRLLADARAIAIESDPRAGPSTAHLLLDEFQDTSAVQWRVLRPVVERLKQRAGASFFCVGDAKQSIYVWRDAEPELLLGLPKELDVSVEPLAKSWRSSPAVVAAVNRVFSALGENPAFGAHELEREVAARFASDYATLEAGREHPGAVRLSVAPAADDDARFPEQPAMDLAVELAGEHLAQDPARSVAILLRRNQLVAYLLQRFAERGIHASGEGGKPLTDSTAVNAALSVLELADHPADTLAGFHVATSVFGPRLGLRVGLADSEARAAARRIRADLARRGAAAVLEDLAASAASELSLFEQHRMRQLVDLAARLERERGLRPAQVAARLAATKVEDPRAAAVRVMTVHKAKGLEFDVVILPELDRPLVRNGKPWVARRPAGQPAAPFEAVSRSGTKELRAWVPALDKLYREDRRRDVREALCALYVGMTRASHALELVVAASDKPPGLSFAGILRGAFGDTARPGAPQWVARHGEMPVARAPLAPPRVAAEGSDPTVAGDAPTAAPPIVFAASRAAREWTRTSPSSLEGGGLVAVADRLADKSAAFARGSRVHAWIEAILWIEDGAPDRAALAAIARRCGLGGGSLDEDLEVFARRLAQPAFHRELSRSAAAQRLGEREEGLEVWRERRFAMPVDSGGRRELLHGAFDRVVVARRSGTAVAAELVDFKTDAVDGDPGAVAARIEHYRPQIASYRAALARILGLPPERIAARLVFLDPAAREPISAPV